MTTSVPLRIGTRASLLARTQTGWVTERLRAHGIEVSIEVIGTRGDERRDVPIAAIGGDGVFVRELEQALLDGRIDAAVHSLKDMPTAETAGLTLAGIPVRATPFDALVGRTAGRLEDTHSELGPLASLGRWEPSDAAPRPALQDGPLQVAAALSVVLVACVRAESHETIGACDVEERGENPWPFRRKKVHHGRRQLPSQHVGELHLAKPRVLHFEEPRPLERDSRQGRGSQGFIE
jgi:hypothetical protein